MIAKYALCPGAGLRICDTCRRHVDHNPKAAGNPYQPSVSPPNGPQCPYWLAKPASALHPNQSS